LGLNRLLQFFVNDNKLTGEFPDGWLQTIPYKFLTNVDISNNQFNRKITDKICMLSVYEEGETVEFGADCDICDCDRLCYRQCEENKK